MQGIPGATISVEQRKQWAPTGKPISIEITGDEFDALNKAAKSLKLYLDSLHIAGVEELKSDLSITSPQLKNYRWPGAGESGRNIYSKSALLCEDPFSVRDIQVTGWQTNIPINLRIKENQRSNVNLLLLNQSIIYRDMNMGGQIRQVPMSSYGPSRNTAIPWIDQTKKSEKSRYLRINVLVDTIPTQSWRKVQAATKIFWFPQVSRLILPGNKKSRLRPLRFLINPLMVSMGNDLF